MDYAWQLPLADELFEARPPFTEALDRYQRCVPIVDRLRGLPDGTTLEQVLEELTAQAASYPPRRAHLVAVQFYLRDILWNCGEIWWNSARRVTNHVALLDRIDRWRYANDERVLLVTFNYDRLIERALSLVPDLGIHAMEDYVASPDFRLIKLHGSVDWGHKVRIQGEEPQVLTEIIDAAERGVLEVDRSFVMGSPPDSPTLPALAIPVVRKEGFECPPAHVEALNQWLPEVDRVLIIGWRGTEASFLQRWGDLLKGDLKWLAIVAESSEATGATLANLGTAGIRLVNVREYPLGFSGIVGDSDFLGLLAP